MVGGRILLEGTPDEIAADPRVREVYLGKARHEGRAMAEPLLALRTCAPAMATRSCSTASRSRCRSAAASRCSGATASASRRCCSPSWATPTWRAARSAGAARRSRGRPPHRRARARARLGRAGARDLPLAQRGGEPHRRVAPRAAGTCKAVYELFPRLAERRAQHGQPALRRRAADAGDRARADDQSGAAAARRAARRASRRSSSRS